jgi:hypothetical protein
MGFAPADDPEILILIAYDRPNRRGPGDNYSTTGIYISGGNMPAVKMGPLMAEVLDYLGVEKKYSAEESAAVDVVTPNVKGIAVKDAANVLKKQNLKYRTVGEGATVLTQIPAPQAKIPGGSTVILYLGDAVPEESGIVPNVVNMSYEQAKQTLEAAGFFMRSGGVSVYYSNSTIAQSQSIAPDTSAPVGTDMMPLNGLDYETMNEKLDVVQFNHYNDPNNLTDCIFWFDYLRTLKDRPFWNTETQTTWNGSVAMVKNDGSKLNEDAFWDAFNASYGKNARVDEPHFYNYYVEDLSFDEVMDSVQNLVVSFL